jgi:ribonucleoside-diphosphate reductase alpha chain
MAKEGSTIGGMMDCFGTAVSMSLQYGVPLEVYVKKFSHTRFEPMGHTKNPDVRFAKSIIDYIFRWLAVTFLPGYREANNGEAPALPGPENGGVGGSEIESMPAAMMAGGQTVGQGPAATVTANANGSSANGQTNGRTNGSANRSGVKTKATIAVLQRTAISTAKVQAPVALANRSEQFASFQTDAPACDSCGAITVRNGNCYLCHNCGNSMGCS